MDIVSEVSNITEPILNLNLTIISKVIGDGRRRLNVEQIFEHGHKDVFKCKKCGGGET